MTRIALITNPHSGNQRDGLEDLQAVAARAGIPVAETRDLDALRRALSDFASKDVDILAVHGGDGTVDTVLTLMRRESPFEKEPALALLNGGTTNMTHADVGLSGAPAPALERVLAAAATGLNRGNVRRRRPIRLTREGDPEPIYGFFFGTAAIPRVIRKTRARLHTRGLDGPVGQAMIMGWSLLRLLSGFVARDAMLHPDRVRYRMDNGPWRERSAVILVATTLDRLLLGLNPAPPGGGLGVAALTYPYRGLWYRLPRFLRGTGRLGDRAGLWRGAGTRLILHTDADYTLDGELFEGTATRAVTLQAAAPVRFIQV